VPLHLLEAHFLTHPVGTHPAAPSRVQAHADFSYTFRYKAFWMRPAASDLLHALCSLLIKMLLMHTYAALFMLLAQANHRDAFYAEGVRRLDRWRRWVWPRPPVRRIQVHISAPTRLLK